PVARVYRPTHDGLFNRPALSRRNIAIWWTHVLWQGACGLINGPVGAGHLAHRFGCANAVKIRVIPRMVAVLIAPSQNGPGHLRIATDFLPRFEEGAVHLILLQSLQ